ncbi:hypothetical protein CONPUDRAFT_87096 [Coniophora puteana RWD-64-598 SS2]|uniref:Uncharacterized protein n=1 Tax=Coniophora puteana (strain RWD-64-598) TaxID=741705 RepID=A0A5M3N6Z1_CONPW|nr:uncharacterized protein CONPUDRAFT_87096 [Coniophora puteana RWD-64-598 SS2]EIW87210.1 hypothetical protein CONPUDRAFT_87096 [Coniophora puteana RWD-64-598 SS2]
MTLQAKGAALIGLIIEELLYGAALLMFASTAWVVLTDVGPRCRSSCIMILIATTLFIMSTAHMVVVVLRQYEGFVTLDTDPESFFQLSSNPFVTAKVVIYVLETLLAETLLVYRCYLVWQKRWLVLPFVVIDSASLAIGIWLCVNVVQSGMAFHDVVTHALFVSVYVMVLFTNLTTTGLLSYKVWITQRSAPPSCRGLLRPSLEVILECGVLYSLCLIAVVLSATLTTYGLDISINMVGQMIPITFYAGLLRVRMSRRSTECSLPTPGWQCQVLPQNAGLASYNAEIEIRVSNVSEERHDSFEPYECIKCSDSSAV